MSERVIAARFSSGSARTDGARGGTGVARNGDGSLADRTTRALLEGIMSADSCPADCLLNRTWRGS